MTDGAIVNRVRGGDREAFALLVDRYRNAVYGLAYYHLRSAEDARDAAQEAFVLAFQRLEQLQEPAKFAPWLRQVTVNACRAWRRQRALDELPETVIAAGDMASRVETRVVVEAALACLSSETRLTLTLFYVRDYSLAEIAAFLDVPVTTVKSRLRDARARLRKELTPMMQEWLTPEPLPADFTVKVMDSLKADGAVYHLAFSPDGRLLAHETYRFEEDRRVTGDIYVRDITGGALETTIPVGLYITDPVWSSGGKTIAFGCHLSYGGNKGWSSEVRLWDRETGDVRTLGSLTNGLVRSVALSPDGKLMATGSGHKEEGRSWGEVRVWDIDTERVLWGARHLTHVLIVAFSPDGRLLATSSGEWSDEKDGWSAGDIRLWDAATGQLLRTMAGPNALADCQNLAFSPDGKLLATGYGREGALLDVQTGERVRRLTGHEDRVFAVTFSPDGRLIATGSHDKTVRLWNSGTAALLRSLTGHEQGVHAVAFTPDGRALASADIAGVVKLWRIR